MSSDHSGIKLEINNRNLTGKSLNIWKQNHMLLHNPLIKEEIQSEITKYFDLRENKNTIYQNSHKQNAYVKKYKKSQSNDLNFHIKKLEQKSKLNTTKRNEIKVKVEINEIESKDQLRICYQNLVVWDEQN